MSDGPGGVSCGKSSAASRALRRASALVLLAALSTAACSDGRRAKGEVFMGDKVVKSDEEWRSQLTDEQYHVTRERGTERAFTGKYWDEKRPGEYRCVGCGLALFSSETKYESGCGWPSFYDKLHAANIVTAVDTREDMVRTELLCARCGAHLGHVFKDGPGPTGLRYCINSAALDFVEKK